MLTWNIGSMQYAVPHSRTQQSKYSRLPNLICTRSWTFRSHNMKTVQLYLTFLLVHHDSVPHLRFISCQNVKRVRMRNLNQRRSRSKESITRHRVSNTNCDADINKWMTSTRNNCDSELSPSLAKMWSVWNWRTVKHKQQTSCPFPLRREGHGA